MMFNKIVSIIILVALIFLSTSCAILNRNKIKKVPMKNLSSYQNKDPEILSFRKTTGEYVELSEDNPGRISNNNIVWWDVESFSVPLSEVKEIEIGFNNRWKGARKGFVYGAIPCGLLGGPMLAGFTEGYTESEFSTGEKIVAVSIGALIVGTAFGLILGAPIGYAIGSKESVIFSTELDSTSTKKEEKP